MWKLNKKKPQQGLSGFEMGGRPGSNRRPLEPQSSALTN